MEQKSTGPLRTQRETHPAVLARRRSRIFRSAVWLLVGALLLVLAILINRDVRRKAAAVTSARECAEVLGGRIGPRGNLPLNLDPRKEGDTSPQGTWLTPISREDARLLRDVKGEVVVAYTAPFPQLFGKPGRGVVLFSEGRCRGKWLPLTEFDRRMERQRALLSDLATRKTQKPPDLP
jgi:hypothetical protein